MASGTICEGCHIHPGQGDRAEINRDVDRGVRQNHVGVGANDQDVIPLGTQRVPAVNPSTTGPTGDVERVGIGPAGQVHDLDPVQNLHLARAPREGDVRENKVGVPLLAHGIHAGTADQGVVAATAIQSVVPALAIQQIVPESAMEDIVVAVAADGITQLAADDLFNPFAHNGDGQVGIDHLGHSQQGEVHIDGQRGGS